MATSARTNPWRFAIIASLIALCFSWSMIVLVRFGFLWLIASNRATDICIDRGGPINGSFVLLPMGIKCEGIIDNVYQVTFPEDWALTWFVFSGIVTFTMALVLVGASRLRD